VEPQLVGVDAGVVVIFVAIVGRTMDGRVRVGIVIVVVVPFTTTVPPTLPPRVKARASSSAASLPRCIGEASARAAKAQALKMVAFMMRRGGEV